MYAYRDTVDTIADAFLSSDVELDSLVARQLMKRILLLSNTARPQGLDKLFPFVVKFLASNDMTVKKQACWFISQNAHKENLLVLTINTLQKDCLDANPMIRGLALRTITSLPHESFLEFSLEPLKSGLLDRSAYVRRTAVTGCAKLTTVPNGKDWLKKNGLVDSLYQLLRDADPIVISNCLHSLENILKDEGGMVVNKSIAYHILNKLDKLTDWGVSDAFFLLPRYSPHTEKDIVDIMNLVDPYLSHDNAAVVIGALSYFLSLCKNLPHIEGDVYARVVPRLLTLMNSESPEMSYLTLDYIDHLQLKHLVVFQESYKGFFCKYQEPLYVKIKRIQILPKIVTNKNMNDILEELSMHSSSTEDVLSKISINAMETVSNLFPDTNELILKELIKLLRMKNKHSSSNALQVMQHINLREIGCFDNTLIAVKDCLDLVDDELGQRAFIWIIGEYSHYIEDSASILAHFVEQEESTSSEYKCDLLTSAVKVFLHHPAKMQDHLGSLLESCSLSNNILVKERSLYYHNILKDTQNAMSFLFNSFSLRGGKN